MSHVSRPNQVKGRITEHEYVSLYNAALWCFNLTPHWAEGKPMPPAPQDASAAAAPAGAVSSPPEDIQHAAVASVAAAAVAVAPLVAAVVDDSGAPNVAAAAAARCEEAPCALSRPAAPGSLGGDQPLDMPGSTLGIGSMPLPESSAKKRRARRRAANPGSASC